MSSRIPARIRSWTHTVRATFIAASVRGRAAMLAAPAGVIAAVTVGLVLLVGSGDSAPPPAIQSETYGTDLVQRLGGDPEAVTAGVVEGLLGDAATPETQAAVVSELAQALAGPESESLPADEQTDAVLTGLIRRLGPDAAEADSTEELIALLVAEIDPDGQIDTPAALIDAVETWAATRAANVLQIVPPARTDGGPLVSIRSAGYEETVGQLEAYRTAAEVLDVPLPGIDGLEPLIVPAVEWTADDATRSIIFRGTTSLFDRPVPLLLLAHWGAAEMPSLSVAVRTEGWSLGAFGLEGALADYVFPDLTFVLATDEVRLPLGSVPPAAAAFFTETIADPPQALRFRSGVNLLAALPLDTLPSEALDLLGVRATDAPVGLRGALGSEFAILAGGPVARPAGLFLEATLPPIEPPGLPDWLGQPDDARWRLTLASLDGGLSFGLSGTLEARIDGARRPFGVQLDLATDGEATGTLRGELLEPWARPFDVRWLTFDRLVMELALDAANAAARFRADLEIAGRPATLEFELRDGSSGGGVDLTATLERLTAAEAIAFLANRLDVQPPAAVPDLALRDIALNIRTGAQASLAFAAVAEVRGRQADVLLSTIRTDGAGRAVVLGVRLGEWGLAEALPSLAGTLLEEIRFPPTALILSTVETELGSTELAEPVRQFFAPVAPRDGDGFTLELRAGLSMVGSVSFAGTALEAPMAALGFTDASFPVVGTVPGSLIGLGGGGAGTALDALALSVRLPPIAPPGAPAWFEQGQVSLEITGRPSLTLQGAMTVTVEDDVLTFRVGSQFARAVTGVSLSLFGALEADEPWEQPFGIEWLTLHRVALELSIDAIGNVGVGFAGAMVLGEKDIDVAVKLEVNASGVPTNLIVSGASEAGVSTHDLLLLQQQIARAADPDAPPLTRASDQPEIALRNIEFRFAPKASPVLGVEAGFVLAGDAFIAFERDAAATRFAFLDLRITDEGLFARGHLSAYELGPLAWDDIDLDLEISPRDQHFRFDGGVEVFGLRTQIAIDVSTRSIFFAGQQALADLRLIVAAFEAFVADPVAAVDGLPLVLDELGVAPPRWLTDLLGVLRDLADQGQHASTAALDVVLNGGRVPLVAFPPGGDPPVCSVLTPFEVDGRCYTTPPLVSEEGVPAGGDALTCGALTPQLHTDGRCYTTRPSHTTACPIYAPQPHTDGKCYTTKPSTTCTSLGCITIPGVPPEGVDEVTTTIPGVPSGGTAPEACSPVTPVRVGSRCYTVPPGDLVPGIPLGGDPRICGALVATFEDGRCWTVSPSQAEAGLAWPGLCTTYANISCTWNQLLSRDLGPLLLDGLRDRLSDW